MIMAQTDTVTDERKTKRAHDETQDKTQCIR